jgi:hypothetical protein
VVGGGCGAAGGGQKKKHTLHFNDSGAIPEAEKKHGKFSGGQGGMPSDVEAPMIFV